MSAFTDLEKRPELLHESNSAVSRVLNCKKATGNQLTEANALKARNLKTLWRLDFEQLGDLAKRREAATNRALREAYEAYRRAFIGDLNHYWSGLAALQQGTLALDLAKEEGWPDTFDNSSQALADTFGKPTGDDAGGTAHMVKIARGAGTIVVRVIDSAQLLT